MFRFYKNGGQQNIYLYKKQEGSYSGYTTFVGYTRDLTENYGTLCLPCAATIEGAEVYSVEGVDSKDAPKTLYLTKVEGRTVRSYRNRQQRSTFHPKTTRSGELLYLAGIQCYCL